MKRSLIVSLSALLTATAVATAHHEPYRGSARPSQQLKSPQTRTLGSGPLLSEVTRLLAQSLDLAEKRAEKRSQRQIRGSKASKPTTFRGRYIATHPRPRPCDIDLGLIPSEFACTQLYTFRMLRWRQRLAVAVQREKTRLAELARISTVSTFSSGPIPCGAMVFDAANQALGKSMAADRGWTGSQWTALDALVMAESAWNRWAKNCSSSACGIPQAIPCTIWGASAAVQIDFMLDYIAGRFGTPLAARSFQIANGWY